MILSSDGGFPFSFPYLIQQTPELPSLLQAWWDREGIHAPLYLILCGSQLSAMAALGAESAPLFGRFNAGIFLLDPLRYEEVAAFYADSPHYGRVEKMMYAILGAVANGETQFGRIQDHTGVDRNVLFFYLKNLRELGWIRRELPFGETSDRRALYQVADPFLAFWYRFVAPLSSALQFSDPRKVYAERVAPYLADYMGLHIFEEICAQWLRRHAEANLGSVPASS
jgi:AAA+ ATPase superfamily predicted ATPase